MQKVHSRGRFEFMARLNVGLADIVAVVDAATVSEHHQHRRGPSCQLGTSDK